MKDNRKIVIWVRSSTKSQEVESQRKETEEYALTLGFSKNQFIYMGRQGASAYKVAKEYMEDIENLLYTINSGEVAAVVVWHLNRLSRNEEVAMRIKNVLITNRVQLYVREPTLTLLNSDGTVNAGMELAYSLFATLSKQQAIELKAKMKRAKDRNRANGVYNGGNVRYGYIVTEDGRFAVSEDKATLIREIYNRYADGGISLTALSMDLKERGHNISWKSIHSILTSTKYYDNTLYPPIITKELFDKVQNRLSENSSSLSRESTNREHRCFLNRILRCKCGMGYTKNHNQYVCSNRVMYNGGQHSPYVSIPYMDGLAWLIASNREVMAMRKDSSKEKAKIKNEIKRIKAKITVMESTIAKAEIKRQRARNLYIDGDITKEEYNDKITYINDEYKSESDKLNKWKAEVKQMQSLLTKEESRLTMDETNSDYVQSLTEDKASAIVRKWIKSVYISDDLIITINLTDGTVYQVRNENHKPVGGIKFHTLDNLPLRTPKVIRDSGFRIETKKPTQDELITLLRFLSFSQK